MELGRRLHWHLHRYLYWHLHGDLHGHLHRHLSWYVRRYVHGHRCWFLYGFILILNLHGYRFRRQWVVFRCCRFRGLWSDGEEGVQRSRLGDGGGCPEANCRRREVWPDPSSEGHLARPRGRHGRLSRQLQSDLLGDRHGLGKRVLHWNLVRRRWRLVVLQELCGNSFRLLGQDALLLLPGESAKGSPKGGCRRGRGCWHHGGRSRRRLGRLQALLAQLGPHGGTGSTHDLRRVVGPWGGLGLFDLCLLLELSFNRCCFFLLDLGLLPLVLGPGFRVLVGTVPVLVVSGALLPPAGPRSILVLAVAVAVIVFSGVFVFFHFVPFTVFRPVALVVFPAVPLSIVLHGPMLLVFHHLAECSLRLLPLPGRIQFAARLELLLHLLLVRFVPLFLLHVFPSLLLLVLLCVCKLHHNGRRTALIVEGENGQ